MENSDLQYLSMRSMQERPITLGELLLREEGMEVTETIPTRSMGRTLSPTRCLGSLAAGHPRRARGRTLARQSTSAGDPDDTLEPQQSLQASEHRRRTLSGPFPIPTLARWRNPTAEARLRNFYSIMNGSRASRRHGASAAARPRQRSLERSASPDLFFNPFSWQRRRGRSVGRRQTRSRSASARPITSRPLYAGRPHSGRPDPETRRHTTNGSSRSELPGSVSRFIDFAAEFIPVEEQPPDAEPPEWSLNITAADFGPFAVGRSALSRARSLAVMGALSQVIDEPVDAQSNLYET